MIIRPKRPTSNRKNRINDSCVNTTSTRDTDINIVFSLACILKTPPQTAFIQVENIKFNGEYVHCLRGFDIISPGFKSFSVCKLSGYIIQNNKLYYLEYEDKLSKDFDKFNPSPLGVQKIWSPITDSCELTNQICIDSISSNKEFVRILKKMVRNIFDYYDCVKKLLPMKLKV